MGPGLLTRGIGAPCRRPPARAPGAAGGVTPGMGGVGRESRRMPRGTPSKHFSMIRTFHLADLFTIANGFCGVAALFETMKYLSTHDRRASTWLLSSSRSPCCWTCSTGASRAGGTSLADGARARLAGRRDLVRRGPGGHRLRGGPEQRAGPGGPPLLRRLRGEPPGPLQRHRRELSRRGGQGQRTSRARRSRPASCRSAW